MSDVQPAIKTRAQIPLHYNWRPFGELALEEINVLFKAIFWSHFDGEEVKATPHGFLMSSILCEEGLSDLCEVIERSGW